MTADAHAIRRIVIASLSFVCFVAVIASEPLHLQNAFAAESAPSLVPDPSRRSRNENVTMSNGHFNVRVEAADLREVLNKIARLAKVPIVMDPSITTTVTARFEDFPLDRAVERLLSAAGERNLAMEFSRSPGSGKEDLEIEKITVVRGAPKQRRSNAEIAAGIEQRERELKDYFSEMDLGKGKIARALRKRVDPATSLDERMKLKTYLRQTPVDDPEDKEVLKAALMDTRFKGDVVSDIQMALLHAIQSHPEESDKNYIVALLERRDNRVGWLYYAMQDVWDERYVPYLIENVIKEQGFGSVEILGRMHVKEAVPFLEVALKSKTPEMRVAARDALFAITGRRYQIQ